MKKIVLWTVSVLCILIIVSVGTFQGLKRYYKAHDVQPELTFEVTSSIRYLEDLTLSWRQTENNQTGRDGLKNDLGMPDKAVDDFYQNPNRYYLYEVGCKIENKSEYLVYISEVKNSGEELRYWAEFPSSGFAPYEISSHITDDKTEGMYLFVKDIKPEAGFEKKILKLLENNDLQVAYKKGYENYKQYLSPNSIYHTNVLVKR